MAQHVPELAIKWIDPNAFFRQVALMVYVELAAALCGADADPVGGLVGDASKAGLLDEGLEQDGSIAIVRLPVTGDGARCSCQDGRGQVSTLDPRQDQEARIVDHSMQVLLPLAGAPADEAITRPGFPGGSAEPKQGDEVVAGVDEVA